MPLVAHGHVVLLLSDQNLAYRVAANRGLDGILDVRHVDAKAGRHGAVDCDIEIGLTEVAQQLDVVHAGDGCHDRSDLLTLLLENGKVIPEDLERQRSLGAGHRLADVVLDRLREVPSRAGVLLRREVHGCDQLILVLVKDRSPLIVRFEVDKILGVAESTGVSAVIGPACLRHHRLDLRKRREDKTFFFGKSFAFGEAGAVGQGAARPDRAFIQMRQKLRTDDPAESQVDRSGDGNHTHPGNNPAMTDRPADLFPIPGRQKLHDPVAPLLESPAKEYAG